jgi:2-oxoglutarate ferredoxin oxidoreductase subunit gamma
MAQTSILLAGFGGQGILFAGKVLAYCGQVDGRELSWLPSYGPEMRGGTANCGVCLSDEPVASPLVLNPDILVVMNTPSYEKFIGSVVPGGVAFVDSSMVDKTVKQRSDIQEYDIPATRLARDEGLDGLANIIILGMLFAKCPIASPETVRKALEKCVPAGKQHLLEANLKAIALGGSH